MTGRFLFVVGAHKAGTTSVAHWLGQHEEIALARSKEPNVFAHRDVTGRDDPYWAEFSAGLIKLDASTNYSKRSIYPGVAERLRRFSPAAKIVYLTRDPLTRLWSGWRQHLDESGYPIARDFSTALRADRSLIDATLYADQLAEYQKYFPAEQIFTLPLESLVSDSAEQDRLLSFAGVQPAGLALRTLNAGGDKRQDRVLVDRALGSAVGKRAADALRASRLRPGLAQIRRRALLKPIDLSAEENKTWDNVPDAQLIIDSCHSYLRRTGSQPTLWPSLPLLGPNQHDTGTDRPIESDAGEPR